MPERVQDHHPVFAAATSLYQIFACASISVALAVIAPVMGVVATLWI
jgi:hypothetical protein